MRKCENCGANLDSGERCDCEKEGGKSTKMFAIQNHRTGKFMFGTDYRYNPPRQRTSCDEMRTYYDLRDAVIDYNNRRCGKDYRIVVLKPVEVEEAQGIIDEIIGLLRSKHITYACAYNILNGVMDALTEFSRQLPM